MKMQLTVAVAAAALAVPGVTAGAAHADGSRTTFVARAVEKAGNLVTLPVHQGTSQGRQVWYVVLDASTSEAAATYGVNRSNKLRNARGSSAVQKVSVRNGVIDFPASVDFAPVRVVVPGPTGFPPTAAAPGAVGETGYSPLVQLPDGGILNASHVATTRAGGPTRWSTSTRPHARSPCERPTASPATSPSSTCPPTPRTRERQPSRT